MKKAFFAAILLLACGFIAQANAAEKGYEPTPRPANETSVSYGVVSVPTIIMFTGGVLGTAFSVGLTALEDFNSIGAVSAGYYRYLNNHVAVGCDCAYEYINFTMKLRIGKDDKGNPIYKSGNKNCMHYTTIIPGVKLPWFNFKHCGIYSKLNAGISVCNQPVTSVDDKGVETVSRKTGVSFAFQLTPIGVDFGGELVRGFVEAGFGYQGMIMGGVRFAF